MRALRGITLPNVSYAPWLAEDLAAVRDLAPDGLLALVYPDDPFQAERSQQLFYLWRNLGKPPLLLRVYAGSIISFDPVEWARTCAGLVGDAQKAGLHVSGLLAWNEPNIEGLDNDDWGRMADWENAFADEYSLMFLSVPLHRPALAPVRNYRLGYETRAAVGSPRFSGGNDLHVYTQSQHADLEFLHGLFPDKPICLSEYNFASWETPRPTVQEFLSSLPNYVESAVYFTSRWLNPPPGSPDVDLLTKPELYQEFKEASVPEQPVTPLETAPGGSGGISEGGTTMLKDQYPDAFSAWEAAGGVEDNFAAHLRGIGVLPPTIQGALDSLDRAEANLRQVRNILGSLPPL